MANTTTIHVHLNGEPRELERGTTVDAFVRGLGLVPEFVAVELNQALVPRAARTTTAVEDGDRIEVVTLVGGG